jgi:hypothetical protein
VDLQQGSAARHGIGERPRDLQLSKAPRERIEIALDGRQRGAVALAAREIEEVKGLRERAIDRENRRDLRVDARPLRGERLGAGAIGPEAFSGEEGVELGEALGLPREVKDCRGAG